MARECSQDAHYAREVARGRRDDLHGLEAAIGLLQIRKSIGPEAISAIREYFRVTRDDALVFRVADLPPADEGEGEGEGGEGDDAAG